MTRLAEVSDRLRHRATSVFNYLAELSRLRAKTIRDVGQYPAVFWFDDVPRIRGCYTIAWGGEDQEHVEEAWLEIKKHSEPKVPAPPESCRKWINDPELYNSDKEPMLRERIVVASPIASETDQIVEQFSQEPEYLHLEDHPEVRRVFQEYVSRRWNAWAEVHREWKDVQATYAALFKIHQELLRMGEQYELVLGLGFLTWKTPLNETIRRHILVAQAALEFDAASGVFTLRASAEGAKVRLETDMLQPGERPAVEQQRAIEQSLEPAAEDPWDKSVIIPALKGWAQSLHDRGEFDESLTPQTDMGAAPRITLAPALVLRRRTGQTVLSALEKIIQRIEEAGEEIPPEILRLVCDPDEFNEHFEKDTRGSDDPPRPTLAEPVFFPLPANDEQRRIVEAIRHRRGVLVQGPPGTGKSHTIANLICHLLATGKRVLITAQTPRALRVLQDKLPAEIAPLCVSLLGNDRSAMQNLENSVAEISNRYARWDQARNRAEVARLEREQIEAQGRLAQLERGVRELRERETHQHEVAGQTYRGTAQQIAAQLSSQASEFAWFQDRIPPEQELTFGPSTFQHLRRSLLEVDANRLAELKQNCPAPGKLLSPRDFVILGQEEARAAKIVEGFADARGSTQFGLLSGAASEAASRLAEAVRSLRVCVQSVQRRPLKWIGDAIYGILTDQDTPWRSLREITSSAFEGLKDTAMRVDRCALALPDERTPDQVLADASDLKAHLDAGKGLGFLFFRSEVVRRTRYLAKEVRVDGRPCSSQPTLGILVEALGVRRTVDHLWSMWSGKADRRDGPLALQVSELHEHLEALEAVLAIGEKLTAAKEACRGVNGMGELPWHDAAALEGMLHTYEAVEAERKLQEVRSKFGQQVQTLSGLAASPNAHPLTTELISAMEARNAEQYGRCLSALERTKADIEKVRQRTKWLADLKGDAPGLARDLAQIPSDDEWDSRLPRIADAWNWARAVSWLEEYLRPGREEQLESQIAEARTEIGNLTSKLAAARAWGFFFERMTESQRQHLNAWQQAIKRIGKGTGKYAAKNRRHAQEHLDACRGAIPAWVMPLFRVFETVSPEPEMFDVLIVDEASQCGPEALILLYLAKRVIVVGDDQQISPVAVGVNQEDVDYLIRQHLTEVDHADSFGVTSSFFDHGVIRYGNRIVLREHFRCMPEIIRFSNNLCYSGSPLIPLRQYPPRRLRPVVTRHVREGFREGTSSSAFNRLEAEAS